MWKSIRVSSETHKTIKTQAALHGISIELYMALIARIGDKIVIKKSPSDKYTIELK